MSPQNERQGQRLSAVIVNHNAGATLIDCVSSLRRAGITEIVVVDNASSDGSLSRLAEVDRDVLLCPTGKNLGYGAAANIGIARTNSEFVLVCNTDLVVDEDVPDVLAKALEVHDDAAIVGPYIVSNDGSVYPSARAFPSLTDAVGHAFVGIFRPDNRWSNRYRNENNTEAVDETVVDWVSGACMLVRRVAFSSVGGFDERYFMYVEDLDLCWRLRRSGWQTCYVPSARVVHEGGVSAKDHPYRMLIAHHESTWRFVHRSVQGPERILLPVIGLGIGARLAIALGQTFAARNKRPGTSTAR